MKRCYCVLFLLLTVLMAGCSASAAPVSTVASRPGDPSQTPFQPEDTAVATQTPLPTATPEGLPALRISAAVPAELRAAFEADPRWKLNGTADLTLDVATEQSGDFERIYALVAPFPTLTDDASSDEIRQAWSGLGSETFSDSPLVMDAETEAVFAAAWGSPAEGAIQIVASDELTDTLWNQQPSWGIVPFGSLNPRLKVLSVDGMTPMLKGLDTVAYPLAVYFAFSGEEASVAAARSALDGMPLTNRDEEKMTVLLMTGVTALVRDIAIQMERKGILFPEAEVGDWMRSADITHTSNEVSFTPDCGYPDEYTMTFCSDPKYFELLQETGVDVVELTGNHLNDYGTEPLLYTLDMYREAGMKYYGGGANIEDASQPVLIEDHGNKIAFMGCNPAGPTYDWATETEPGSLACDYDSLHAKVTDLSEQGYNVIFTFQYTENCTFEPMPTQRGDFQRMAEAGAVIVNGSQAHCPQAFGFVGDHFIHYGLGNLFFDQMMDLNRNEFLDRHVFYDGQYLGVELLTAKLYEYAQPRIMTPEQREALLNAAFDASDWK